MSRWPLAAGAIVALGALAAGSGGGAAEAEPPPPAMPGPAHSATAVRAPAATAPAGGARLLAMTSPGLAPVAARAFARRRMRAIPLPRGGNFNGVRWPRGYMAVAPAEAERALEYNARCQWLRALVDGRQAAEAEQLLAASARWPAFADEGPVLQAALLADCTATHRREVAYALAHERVPSS